MTGPSMNKTLITIAFLVLILAAVAGNVVLAIVAPDQLNTFNNSVVTILGVGTAAIVTIWGLGQQGEKLKQIESNTNGNLSRLQGENERLTNIIIESGLDLDTIADEDPPRHRSEVPK
jgi:hypothetical protein